MSLLLLLHGAWSPGGGGPATTGIGQGPWAHVARMLKQAKQEDEDLIKLLVEIMKIM